MSQLNVSTSFVQDQRHVSKSEKFVAIQPSQIATVLQDHGFDLVHLKSGRARSQDKADHQTTIARYRAKDAFSIDGLALDIMFKVPHIYGALEARLGFFRGVCANQWNMGQLFERIKVRHSGDCLNEIDRIIPALVAQQGQLVETIKEMMARDVTADQIKTLALNIAQNRLSDVTNLYQIHTDSLLIAAKNIVRTRPTDSATDLFTVTNVLQEAVVRFGVAYQTKSVSAEGQDVVRNMVSRKVNEQTNRAIDLNASIWDSAIEMLQAA